MGKYMYFYKGKKEEMKEINRNKENANERREERKIGRRKT